MLERYLPIRASERLADAEGTQKTGFRHRTRRSCYRFPISESKASGQRIKAIEGTTDTFLRMRVGDYRIMYEVVDADRVVLILGIIQRKDLEQWLRQHS